VTVPAGWKEYEDIVGRFAFMYPPNWQVKSQRAEGVTFVLPPFGILSAGLEDFHISAVGTDDEGVLNQMVTEAAAISGSLYDFKLLDKGIWRDRGYFVEYTLTARDQVYSYNIVGYALFIGIPLVIPLESGSFWLAFTRIAGTMTEEELDMLDILISTVVIK
ncbi:MAG: hypothetical protein H8E35_08520, partial [Ardenticatenia bacterium]|nr:hypothetical protein [Ardenticatenia bacterium]